MKRKYFFGILLSLFLLSGGVFLFVSYKNDSVDVIDQSSAATSDTIYIQVNINGWYINNFKFGDNNAPLNDIKGFVALSNFLNITNGNAAYSFRGVNYASGKATTSAYVQSDGTWKYRSWRWDNAEINSNVCESYSVTSFSSSGASLYVGTTNINTWLATKDYNHYDKSGTVTFILNITVVPKDFWVNINVLDPSGNETYNCGIFDLKDHNNAWTTNLNNEVEGKRIPFGASWQISNIRPATGMKVASVESTNGDITNADYSNYIFQQTGAGDSEVRIRMAWIQNTVTLNQTGGSGGSTSVTATYNSAMPSIEIPIRPGYKFLGYWDKTSCGTQYYNANGGSVRNWDKTSNATLYARWEIYNYKIDINFYQPNGSTQNGGTFDLYKKLSGGSESLVASGATNEVSGQQYLQYNGQFILKNIMPNAGTYITGASLSSTSNNGMIATSGDPINTITYTANQTGQPSGGWDNAIQIYTEYNTLTATLKYQDGATADAKRSATYNSNRTSLLTLPSRPTRTGYKFLGWSLTQNDTGVYYTPESDFNNVAINGKTVSDPNVENLSFNLYAIWQVNTYTTTLNDGTGAVTNFADMMITNYNYTYLSNEYCHTVNGVTITYENGTGTLTLNGTPTNAFTIFINTDLSFKQNEEYSVKYTKQEGSMTGGGTGCFVLEICDKDWNGLSTRNHKDFQMNASSGEAKLTVDENGATYGKGLRLWFWFNANATPARVFNNFKIKITLEKLGENQSVIKTGKVTYDSQIRGVSIPSKIGYTFNGYFDKASGGKQYYKATGVAITEIWKETNNINLYAQWTAHSYTIEFDGNGSTSGSTSSNSATYDSNVVLSSNGFKRTGYVFTGWNTKSDGKGKSYLDKATVKNLTSKDGDTVTLYAQWEDTWANHASSSLETTEINGVTYNVIATAEDLAYLSKQSISSTLLGKYIQTADIDLSDYTWLPIGSEHAFCGEYLGRGHKITGLHTSDAVDAKGVYLQTYGGLFGKLGENSTTDASANIVGVYITDCLVYGQYSGAIAGFSDVDSVNIEACIEACILENVKIYGDTTASFVGSSSDGQIKDCLLISSNISTANATTRGFYTGTMTVNSSYYMNGTTPTQFYTSGASDDYSNWVTGVFKYPLPKALIWYPVPELTKDSLNTWISG